jgi:CheY-like chemotaxis protein
MMTYKNVNILLVDDDRVDVLAVKTALEENSIANPVIVAEDGVKALELLRSRRDDRSSPLPQPYLILLDLNMPRMNGIEFLKTIRSDPALRSSIVFVLTTSNDDRDRVAAYELNVAGYVVKSEVGKDFINLIRLLEDYKIVVQFPFEEAY